MLGLVGENRHETFTDEQACHNNNNTEATWEIL